MLNRVLSNRSRAVVEMLDAVLKLRSQAGGSDSAALSVMREKTRAYRTVNATVQKIRRLQSAMVEQARNARWDVEKAPMRCGSICVLRFGSGETARLVVAVRGTRWVTVGRRALGRTGERMRRACRYASQ
jgi:hypothetical protein